MTKKENDAIWEELNDLRAQVEELKVSREKVAEQVEELKTLHENLKEDADRTERIIMGLEALT